MFLKRLEVYIQEEAGGGGGEVALSKWRFVFEKHFSHDNGLYSWKTHSDSVTYLRVLNL